MTHRYYEDQALLVCEKPRGVISQGGAGDLVGQLAALCGQPIYPVHRLDREVGGVMVFAKTPEAAAALGAPGMLRKEYEAVVHGAPKEPEGRLFDLLYHDPRQNKTFAVSRPRRGVREAALRYRLLAALPGESPLSLLHIVLETGRTHQIRAQFSARRMPLCGDRRYGARDEYRCIALHSVSLTFSHPVSGDIMVFESPLPPIPPFSLFKS